MTPDKTPTPKELEALARKHGATSYRNRADTQHPAYGFTEDGLRNLLADVLAKWGSPVVAVEPQPSIEGPPEVWLQLHGDCAEHELSEPVDYTAGDVTWCWHSIHDSDVRYVRADLVTTPQPTQAQAGAVPLPDDQRKALLQARSTAMHMTAAGRIPECGDFAAIAQNLDWLCNSFGIKEGGQHAER